MTSPTCDPDKRLAFVLFRYLKFWNQTEFSRAAKISQSQISVYEQGGRSVPDEVLDRAANAVGFPLVLLPFLLRAIRAFRLIAEGRWRMRRVLGGDLAASLLALGEQATDSVLGDRLLTEQQGTVPVEKERQEALALFGRLKVRSQSQREALIEEDEAYRTWALCERVAAESIEAAANDAGEALKLAELALRIAELCPGSEAWRSRLQGYAGVHVANARRVGGTMPPAREAMVRAKKLWDAGAAADPGLLNEARVLWLEATLQSADRKFDQALKTLTEAFRVDQGDMTSRLLYAKARVLEGLEDFSGSTAALEEASALVDPGKEPRLSLGIRFQLLFNLCLEGRAAEAEPKLRDIRTAAEGQNKELDLLRVVWLEGMVASGQEAESRLDQVRRELARREIAYDCALVTLELAVVLLSENRTEEVRSLAASLVWIFRSQDIPDRALAALRLFCDAANRETATADFTRRVLRFLYRAQHNSELEFE
jgi:transcriptional regulator with XRE-family HTH domain